MRSPRKKASKQPRSKQKKPVTGTKRGRPRDVGREQLAVYVSKVIHERRAEIRISPSWVATEVMIKIDPKKRAPHLVYIGCHLELRQIARQILPKKFGKLGASPKGEQGEMYPDVPHRFPVARKPGDEPVYILRGHESIEDVCHFIIRGRSEIRSKSKTLDATMAYARAKHGAREVEAMMMRMQSGDRGGEEEAA